jgi:hypothetical protein
MVADVQTQYLGSFTVSLPVAEALEYGMKHPRSKVSCEAVRW